MKLLPLKQNLTPLNIPIPKTFSEPNFVSEIGPVLYLQDLKKFIGQKFKMKSIAKFNEMLRILMILLSSESSVSRSYIVIQFQTLKHNLWLNRQKFFLIKIFKFQKNRNLFY